MFTLLALLLVPMLASAEVPGTLQVDGMLRSEKGAPVVDGLYSLSFAIYGAQTGGKAAWSEAKVPVTVTGGRFRHTLGKSSPIAAPLAALKTAWLGVKVADQVELPRQLLHAVAFALQAAKADKLACSGCVGAKEIGTGAISADKVGFTFAGSKTKGGPATTASDVQCTGCVALSEIAFDGDLDLGGNALKAKVVSAAAINAGAVIATTYAGDGSKLTGLKLPKGVCKKGEAVTGINADGTLVCAPVLSDVPALPKDGLGQVSNGVLTNIFLHEAASGAVPVAISDNDPIGTADLVTFPDVGLAKTLSIKVKLTTSDLSQITVQLYDPTKKLHVLHDKSGKGTKLEGTWPTPDKLVSGDLAAWAGKSPAGTWRLKVVDSKANGGKSDGAIVAWSVVVQTVSNKKVSAAGLLQADGGFRFTRASKDPVPCNAENQAWSYFHVPTKALRICNGTEWVPIVLDNVGTQNNPAKDCKEIMAKKADAKSGKYWIDPDGVGGGGAIPAWCDMGTGGGGWTLLLTLTHPRNQYGGSVHPLATALNINNPDPTKAYSRDWRNIIKPIKGSEFLIKRGTTGQWARFVVNSFCGFSSTSTAPCSGCHGTYASGCVFDSSGKQLSCSNTWLNSCSNCGGCQQKGCDTIGFNIGHADYAAQYPNTQLFGSGWNSSNCEGAWGTQTNQSNAFPVTLFYR